MIKKAAQQDDGEKPTLSDAAQDDATVKQDAPDDDPFTGKLVIIPEPAPLPLYEPKMWRGVMPTFQCSNCGFCDPDQGFMILHVLTHAPEGERETLLDQLTKEMPTNGPRF